jgi:Holliday junction resolvase-like predicted endonuclease
MAQKHPNFPLHQPSSLGEYRERDVLNFVAQGLPDSFDVFHNLNWSSATANGAQQVGEIDLVVVSPMGHLVLLEVKSGAVQESSDGLHKTYGSAHVNIGHQVRRLHNAILERVQQALLPRVQINSLLVLPDHRLSQGIVAYPRERVVDASDYAQLCARITAMIDVGHNGPVDRAAVMDFLANRFDVQPDVGATIEHLQRTTTHMASGLATWVPQIEHDGGVFHIEATAGSGKTQLALKLLRAASAARHKALYLCFNRPLADLMRQASPTRGVECSTFHQFSRDAAERDGVALDFASPAVFEQMAQHFVNVSGERGQRFDLVIVDESQDFESDWISACHRLLTDQGRLYVLGDALQQVYDREAFDIAGAVKIRCLDNFRSPRRVVNAINALGLTPQPLLARSLFEGQTPHFATYAPGQLTPQVALEQTLRAIWADGYTADQVVVLCWEGSDTVKALAQKPLAGQVVKHFTGQYTPEGDPLWAEGELLVESLRRFKGQSAPVVVLYKVDFDTLTDTDRRKLFVGLTRAQLRVDVVLSERAATALMG